MTEINQEQMHELLKDPTVVLLDIREEIEFTEFNIGGINIPAHEISRRINELEAYQTIIVACSNGTRSYILARVVQKKLENKSVLHLEEGIF